MSDIIDFHAHIFPDKIAVKASKNIGCFYDIPMCYDGKTQTLLENGKKAGIEKFVVQSVATTPAQVESINCFIAAEVKKYPDRLIGLGTIHPDCEDIPGHIQKIADLGLRGVKLHPDFQQFNIDDEKAMPIYEAIEGRLPLLIHTGDDRRDYSRPYRLAKVAKLFPKLQAVAAHFGGYRRWEEAQEYLLSCENVYLDTSSSLPFISKKQAVDTIHKFGVQRILFGTDYPMWDHTEELERFYDLGLSEEENRMILYGNAEKLLGLSR